MRVVRDPLKFIRAVDVYIINSLINYIKILYKTYRYLGGVSINLMRYNSFLAI